MVTIRKSAKQRKRRTQHAKTNESGDELLDAALEQYGNIVMMYEMFEGKRSVMLFDIQEQRIYAYPYKEFRDEMNERSQRALKQQYEQAQVDGQIVVFVRGRQWIEELGIADHGGHTGGGRTDGAPACARSDGCPYADVPVAGSGKPRSAGLLRGAGSGSA